MVMPRPLRTALCLAVTLAAHPAASAEHEPMVPCVQRDGLPLVECSISVRHGEEGETTVTATFPNGFKRMLSFSEGRFVRGNPTMSGVGTDTEWALVDGTHLIRVDDQKFEIPDALLARP